MSEGDFLRRWSRRKHEAAREQKAPPAPAPAAAPAPAPPAAGGKAVSTVDGKPIELPPIESLTFDSDFSVFLKANIDESLRRAALKKLLHDPRFNVMDGLDVYIDDYSKDDPIPPEMLRKLEHARGILFPEEEKEKAKTAEAQAREPQAEEAPAQAEAGAQASNEERIEDGDGDKRQDA